MKTAALETQMQVCQMRIQPSGTANADQVDCQLASSSTVGVHSCKYATTDAKTWTSVAPATHDALNACQDVAS